MSTPLPRAVFAAASQRCTVAEGVLVGVLPSLVLPRPVRFVFVTSNERGRARRQRASASTRARRLFARAPTNLAESAPNSGACRVCSPRGLSEATAATALHLLCWAWAAGRLSWISLCLRRHPSLCLSRRRGRRPLTLMCGNYTPPAIRPRHDGTSRASCRPATISTMTEMLAGINRTPWLRECCSLNRHFLPGCCGTTLLCLCTPTCPAH